MTESGLVPFKEKLINILVKNGLISPQQLEEAIQLQKKNGGRLSDIIVNRKLIKHEDLVAALSQGLGLPFVNLRRIKIEEKITQIIPSEIACRYQIIPLALLGNTLTVAMADPLNIFAIDHLKGLTGYGINPVIASQEDIEHVLNTVYRSSKAGDLIENLVKEIEEDELELVKEEKEAVPPQQDLAQLSSEAPLVRFVNGILAQAVKEKASDVLIEPLEKRGRLRFRIDGVLQERDSIPLNIYPLVVSRIKVISGLNIAEHRLPQDGRFKSIIEAREVDFRVSVLPSSSGEKVALRILDKNQAMLDIEKLGFTQGCLEKIKKAARLPHGMILVCGPTGSGKTTTLYSILKFVDSPYKNIVTVEDPVEYQLEGINQVTVKPDIGLTFASALRAILRQDPNVIMIGEIRDFETVDIAIKSALTGHLVLSTLHTTNASGAIVRLINMGVEPYLITSSLICVVAQRLVRRLCIFCRQAYKLSPDLCREIKLNPEKLKDAIFYRAVGCPKCMNLGYKGRTLVAELLMLTPRLRELIVERVDESQLKQEARREGMMTLREHGITLALEGVTSLEEVLRVTDADGQDS